MELDLALALALQNRDRIGCLWDMLFAHLAALLRDAATTHAVHPPRTPLGP